MKYLQLVSLCLAITFCFKCYAGVTYKQDITFAVVYIMGISTGLFVWLTWLV